MLATDTLTLLPAPYWDRRFSAPLSETHSATGFALTAFLQWRASLRFVLGRWLGRAPLLSFGGGFSTSSLGMWSSRRCRRGELTLGWCVPAPREDFTMGWWRQASAVRYGLARRLPRGGHDLTSASWSTFTDLIPFHALFETIQLPCLLLVTSPLTARNGAPVDRGLRLRDPSEAKVSLSPNLGDLTGGERS